MAAAGYTYGIEGVSKNSTAANFVINQGSDAKVLVEVTDPSGNISIAAPTIVLDGLTLATEMVVADLSAGTLLTDAIYLRGAATAAAVTAIFDFSVLRFQVAFPPGSYCSVEVGDGLGSNVSGYVEVGAGGVLSNLVQTQGALLAPVTAATLSIATSILSVAFTGKATPTQGAVRLTRCAI